MTPQQMATSWLNIWLEGAGVHGLKPAPGEPLLRWLLLLHERAVAEELDATEGLSEHQSALLDDLRHEIIATQRDTLPPEAQAAVRAGDIHAVRATETAAIVWTLAALDAFSDQGDSVAAWRARLGAAAIGAAGHVEARARAASTSRMPSLAGD